jgi:hypothetical protein
MGSRVLERAAYNPLLAIEYCKFFFVSGKDAESSTIISPIQFYYINR